MNPPLYESAAVLAVDKPPGVAVIPGRDGPRGASLHEQLCAARAERLWVVHRLDRDTSGVLVFARTARAHRALSLAFEAGQVSKRYLALVEGAPGGDTREVDVPLVPARRGRMRPAREGEEGKPSRTTLRVVERFGGRAALLEATPLTGRTHQIRVHLRSVGHPLVVDHQYGSGKPFPDEATPLLTRTPLHAAFLSWQGLEGVEDVRLEAPLPEDLAAALAHLRGAGA